MHNRGGGFHPPCLSQLSNILNTKSSSSWPIDTIGNVAPAESRRSLGRLSDQCWLLNLDQIEKETGYLGEREWVDPASASTSTHNFNTDHVLYSKLRPNLNKVVCPEESGICTTELIRLKPDPKRLNRKFLTYFLRSEYFMGFARQVVAGAKMPRMVMDRFWEFEIPLPPLPEQHRIVEILDQADALRRQRREADELSKRILPALFQEMFGDPMNDHRWSARSGEYIFKMIGYGVGTPPPFEDEGIPFLRATNIKPQGITKNKLVYFNERYSNSIARSKVTEGQVVIVRRGANTGDCAVISSEFDGAYVGYDLICTPSDMVDPHWFTAAWYSPSVWPIIDSLRTRAAQQGLNKAQIESFILRTPPKKLQDKFAARVKELFAITYKNKQSTATFETLFQTLLHRAFDGSLTAKWREGQSKELLQEM